MADTIVTSPVLERLGIQAVNSGACGREWIQSQAGPTIASINPADGLELASVRLASAQDYDTIVAQAVEIFDRWRMLPAPKRGQIVREIGDELRLYKDDLGALVTLEMGKILAEGKGEVQEMIDIADFAVGLSRQLYGLTMPSERPEHRMYEQWHPLGVVGVISAFNFPVAVWSWNALLAAVCGDCVLWKPSLKTPLTAIATHKICDRVLARHGWRGVFSLIIGDDSTVGTRLLEDRRVPLVSATGSCRMGYVVAEKVARRLGRTLLELGGNNGVIVMNDANLDLALRAVLFGAVGTAGQRCTSIRRLFLQRGIAPELTRRLETAYGKIRVGNPLDEDTLVGPLIDRHAVEVMQKALQRIRDEGGRILTGGEELGGCYARPALVQAQPSMPILKEEVFAPILYLVEFDSLDEVLRWHNDVPQG
ncbi:MAG TPA: aldehyde dehydrogenase family protein, partial [Bryobacteraceae bacterium]|nr:aldehyde dehydrogenase family protein [Bryobacteraceae bacterium]